MKALVILSGGMDSATVLYWAKEHCQAVTALSFNYGSKHNCQELPCAQRLAKGLSIPHRVFDLPLADLFGGRSSSLLRGGDDIPKGHYAEANMAKTVVPFRNGIMLSIAAGYAEAQGMDTVLLGSHQGDHAVYPDCRYEFTQAMNLAAYLGTGSKVRMHAPFNTITKGDIVLQGIKLGVPYEDTWSCYVGSDRPCLKCGTCVERTESSLDAGTPDPARSAAEWQEAIIYYKAAKADFDAAQAKGT